MQAESPPLGGNWQSHMLCTWLFTNTQNLRFLSVRVSVQLSAVRFQPDKVSWSCGYRISLKSVISSVLSSNWRGKPVLRGLFSSKPIAESLCVRYICRDGDGRLWNSYYYRICLCDNISNLLTARVMLTILEIENNNSNHS